MNDDKRNIYLIANGDREAFEKLFRKWYPVLESYAGHYLEAEDARDVVQDVFFNLWKNASSMHIRGEVGAYLYSAVRNRCLSVLDRKNLRERYHSSVRQSVLDAVSDSSYSSVRELGTMLSDALDALPEEQRAAFMKSRSDGLKYKDIAKDGGVSVKTVEYRISQALRHLRVALADFFNS
ncbi:MAG: RNA polymerase sigma-70 factor [Bacteroidales bacterium]|nr:RNA polymerase sigma-70 factor [Bacteroidales bacterium]